MRQNVFPKDFLWGASTASHQIEGNTHNQWTVWELANAKRLAETAPSQLDYLKEPAFDAIREEILGDAANPQNYISGSGDEDFEKCAQDFALLKSLNMNAFRFSIEWSRIEPQPGQWNQSAITHYRKCIAELKALGIEPVLTIWHWTIPVWFAKLGGFEKKRNLTYFYEYVTRLCQEFGEELHYIIVLNEPNVYTRESYLGGSWPPQRKGLLMSFKVYRHLTTAHTGAHAIIKAANPAAHVGIAMSLSESRVTNALNPINHISVALKDYILNWWFLHRIQSDLDFIGINFYATRYYNWRLKEINPSEPLSDVGWYMEPSGLYDVLVKVFRRYNLPIIVTENGLADVRDKYRRWWLNETVAAMEKALKAHIPLKGYLHWSLIDTFEWSSGWWPKFGLVKVDRKTLKRTIRPSAKWFAEFIANLRT